MTAAATLRAEAARRILIKDGPYGTAIQEDPGRPAFRGNGPDDYVCVKCGNVLAEAMHEVQMTYKVRVRCGVCRTVNVSATDVHDPSLRRRMTSKQNTTLPLGFQ